MNTRRMTPAELRAILDAAGITTACAAEMACISFSSLDNWQWAGDDPIPAPISRLLCIHLLFEGLAVELSRPWVPDDLAEVLAPSI